MLSRRKDTEACPDAQKSVAKPCGAVIKYNNIRPKNNNTPTLKVIDALGREIAFTQDQSEAGNYTFKDCTKLTRVRIPNGCTLGTDVFAGCSNVALFGKTGSSAEAYCGTHDNCRFVATD